MKRLAIRCTMTHLYCAGTYEGYTTCFVCDSEVTNADISAAMCPLCNTVLNHTTIKCMKKPVLKRGLGAGAIEDDLSQQHLVMSPAMRPREGGLLGRVQMNVARPERNFQVPEQPSNRLQSLSPPPLGGGKKYAVLPEIQT